MQRLNPIIIFLFVLLLFNACEQEFDDLSIDQSPLPVELRDKAFKGFVNQQPFGTDDIEVRIVQDELHFIISTEDQVFPPPPDSLPWDCLIRDEFIFRIKPFRGIGTYTHSLEDSTVQLLWRYCYGFDLKEPPPFANGEIQYLAKEYFDYLTVDIEEIDIQNEKIKGNIYGSLKSELKANYTALNPRKSPRIDFRASFDTRLHFPLTYRNELSTVKSCAAFGLLQGEDFCYNLSSAVFDTTEQKLLISFFIDPFVFDTPYGQQKCSRGYLYLGLVNFIGVGYYDLDNGWHDDNYNFYDFPYCIDYDIISWAFGLQRPSDYFILEVSDFDLENQSLKGMLFSSLSSDLRSFPKDMVGNFNLQFKIK